MLEHFASKFAAVLGTSGAFLVALILVASWMVVAGPQELVERPRMFLVELTGMFIFIHLFLIQRTHNKDLKALQIKLDELIASKDGANNKLIKAEKAPEAVVDELHEAYEDLADSVDHPTKTISVNKESKSKTPS